MNDIQVFAYDDAMVRTVEVDGAPWFVGKDVAVILEYGHTPHLLRILDDDEKGVHIVDTLGGKQELSVISESGLYHAIFQSRKPEAQKFRKWVTGEVLPAIRKSGAYADEARIAAIAERVASAVAERTAAAMLEKIRPLRGARKPLKSDCVASKEQCGDVLAFCDRYCDVSGDRHVWCKLTDLYSVYKGWVEDKPGRIQMPRFKFKDALAQLYSIIQFSAQTPRGENVYTVRGIGFKDHYWEL